MLQTNIGTLALHHLLLLIPSARKIFTVTHLGGGLRGLLLGLLLEVQLSLLLVGHLLFCGLAIHRDEI